MNARKTIPLRVRVTEHDQARLEEFATKNGLTKSKAVRHLLEVGMVAVNDEGSTQLMSIPAGAALTIAQP